MHIHHLVWGIWLMLLCGFLAFAAPPAAPWWHLIAVGFGVGAGFHARRVRALGPARGRLLDRGGPGVARRRRVHGRVRRAGGDRHAPFGLDEPASIAGTAVAVALIGGLAVVCFAKGRVLLGVIGRFVPAAAPPT